MAPFKQARLMSVVLLFATLAAGILIGVAWSERGSDVDVLSVEVVEPAAEAPDTEEAEAPDPDDERERRRPVIFELDLDSDQLARLEELRQHFMQEFEAFSQELEALDERMDARRWELRRAARDSTRAVLRPDQLARYDSLLNARYSRGNRNDTTRSDGGRGEGRDRGRRPDSQDGNHHPHFPKFWKEY
ncbi:MAG: hypothetical protein OXI71_03850 [Gemmatimonadota bacterium]|nr:hypothetical protein [Gemmatimonadota bacterium]